ncbi:unnamed protein product [Cladocopium goreaui]|uniref:Uncharacterized protein n=1 Tax=Cladocopium goreaui TaxID=2562237 RepID=A0A9P1DSV1_9DINO|nr:unnamed protein product [Cladocopium goreaui]
MDFNGNCSLIEKVSENVDGLGALLNWHRSWQTLVPILLLLRQLPLPLRGLLVLMVQACVLPASARYWASPTGADMFSLTPLPMDVAETSGDGIADVAETFLQDAHRLAAVSGQSMPKPIFFPKDLLVEETAQAARRRFFDASTILHQFVLVEHLTGSCPEMCTGMHWSAAQAEREGPY